MPQMSTLCRIAVLSFLACFGCATAVSAKCADSLVRVYGDIAGPIGPNLRLTMGLRPDPRRTMPVMRIVNSEFDIEGNFDNFLFDVGVIERCGRKLESVELVLLDGDKEITRVKLNVKEDFRRDEATWSYTVRRRVKIQIPAR
jgi:hypothetical protein